MQTTHCSRGYFLVRDFIERLPTPPAYAPLPHSTAFASQPVAPSHSQSFDKVIIKPVYVHNFTCSHLAHVNLKKKRAGNTHWSISCTQGCLQRKCGNFLYIDFVARSSIDHSEPFSDPTHQHSANDSYHQLLPRKQSTRYLEGRYASQSRDPGYFSPHDEPAIQRPRP